MAVTRISHDSPAGSRGPSRRSRPPVASEAVQWLQRKATTCTGELRPRAGDDPEGVLDIMAAIDGVIDNFGGWPGAFRAATEPAGTSEDPAAAAEPRPVYEIGPTRPVIPICQPERALTSTAGPRHRRHV